MFKNGRKSILTVCNVMYRQLLMILFFAKTITKFFSLAFKKSDFFFQESCPPILSIHMGSLGFLCPFDVDRYREYISGVVKGGVPLLLRNRLRCKLEKSTEIKHDDSNSSINSNTESPPISTLQENKPQSATDGAARDATAAGSEDLNHAMLTNGLLSLNEIVISRGPSPFLSNLDLYINDYLVTTVQGDGLIISTPTGSTAYAMAAGASMCHPSVQSIIIAPICPHSLSFRPIVVPAGVELKIAISLDSRHNAWFSVDGRNCTELKLGYHLTITTSEFPVPSICRSDQINDWFEGLATCLHWNQRQKQLPLNSCYLPTNSMNNASSQLQSTFMSRSSSNSSLKQVAFGTMTNSNSNNHHNYANGNNNGNSSSSNNLNSTLSSLDPPQNTAKASFHLQEEHGDDIIEEADENKNNDAVKLLKFNINL
jgi:NAD kinase